MGALPQRPGTKTILAGLLVCLLCLAIPAVAAAATYQVDSNGDQPDSNPADGVCQTAVSTCTLRAAIETANAAAGMDEIDFAPSLEEGRLTISPASALPAITDSASIDARAKGSPCAALEQDPCIGLAAPDGEPGLEIDAAGVTVEGLAITGASVGVRVKAGGEGARVLGDWFGLGTDLSLSPDGTGVAVDGAKGVTIGAPSPGGNRFNGGSIAVSAGPDASELTVEGNAIGLDPASAQILAPPSEYGIVGDASGEQGGFEAARIAKNQIAMTAGEAIRQSGSGARIVENTIGETQGDTPVTAGDTAIHLLGADSFASVVEGNTIAGAGRYGLLIENQSNRVVGNQIAGSAVNGIRVEATGNLIGEDAPPTENTISGSGGAAIAIVDAPPSGNIVARVSGTGNGGLFIDRGADGLGNPGENTPAGIKGEGRAAIGAPSVAFASATRASGTVNVSDTEIRVYAKATGWPGELGKLIAEVPSGGAEGKSWTVAYPTQPAGSYIAVSASNQVYGTSELAIAPTTSKPPRAQIVSGPRRRTLKRSVKFRFRSNQAGSTFVCQLDRKPWRGCRSPRRYRHLRPGPHIFRVRAKNLAGEAQPKPTTRRFRVVGHRH